MDDVACGLADKLRMLGSADALEIVFRVGTEVVEENEKFLPKFREKGRIRFVPRLAGLKRGRSGWR